MVNVRGNGLASLAQVQARSYFDVLSTNGSENMPA